MSKKKKIILAIAIISCIIISFLGGQSYSKYVSQVRGDGTAEIATWNFLVNEGSEEIQPIRLASTYNNETLVDNKIAPGTRGSFNINIDGTGSDVGIDYKVKFKSLNQKPTNLKFIYNGISYNTIEELNDVLAGRIKANESDKTKTYTIEWEWKYETGTGAGIIENDKVDTQNGINILQYDFNVIVTGTQVAPNSNTTQTN